MANITTELPISFDGNNDYQQATRERDILGFNIKAPIYNILTKDILNNPIKNNNSNDNRAYVIKDAGIVEMTDTNHIEAGWNGYLRFMLPKLKIGHSYKFLWQIIDYDDSIASPMFYVGIGYANSKNTSSYYHTYVNKPLPIGGSGTRPIESLIYTPPAHYDEFPYINIWFGTEGSSLKYWTVKLIGLYDITEYLDSNSYTKQYLASDIKITASNVVGIVGEYKISKDINRHLRQIERKIKTIDDNKIFELNWR